GIANNTMIFFCSDNGPARQGSPRHVGTAKNLKGYKLSLNEGGIRVPGLMVWPEKIKEPRTVTAPCFTSDYFPTILAALEAPLPATAPTTESTFSPSQSASKSNVKNRSASSTKTAKKRPGSKTATSSFLEKKGMNSTTSLVTPERK
ncbi:MAG: sulfatase-like hydrolase/transferase, partial [Verrucomicrobia bacterium]|nr:sulfatase-like hydrolase/transferase [Verrucomicrobiota bacterium]